MSKTKSYNQIIFITTLSVYLGLVLVGASPQVLAQAALTNKFELKDQIEQKDDLDKKPDEQTDEFSQQYDVLLTKLLENSKVSGEYKIEVSAYVEEDDLLQDYLFKHQNDFHLLSWSYQLNSKEFISNLKFEINKNTRNSFGKIAEFKQKFSQFCKLESAKNNNKKLIYENTTVTSADNQVFIVTRLPRGSIDSLLK